MGSFTRQTWAAFAAVLIAAVSHVTTSGQGIVVITFPDVIAAGPDFATDVLRDPWDMSNVEDVSLDPGWHRPGHHRVPRQLGPHVQGEHD